MLSRKGIKTNVVFEKVNKIKLKWKKLERKKTNMKNKREEKMKMNDFECEKEKRVKINKKRNIK